MPQNISPELSAKRRAAAYASGEARRQQRDESITIKISPAHRLSPAQLAAWRALWSSLLAPSDGEEQDGGAA